MAEHTDNNHASVAIGRQPIFDRKKKLWGYELFCVGSPEAGPSGWSAEPSVAIHVQSSAYVCLQHITEAGRNVMIDFPEKSILEHLPYVLPPRLAAIKVSERAGDSPSILEELRRMKSDGFLIAVDRFSATPRYSELYQLADILAMEVEFAHPDALGVLVSGATPYNASLMAMRVQSEQQLKLCMDLGFAHFHGSFFKVPEHITVRKLHSNEVLRFALLKAIESDELDVAGLAEKIQSDATISLRLLAYLNSAAFVMTQKVKSVSHAIHLLGWNNVKNWLRVILLSDLSQSKEAHELVLLSAQRGLFMQLVTKDHDFWGFDPQGVHLLGLFSLLDVLMGMPMATIVGNLPLDRKMKAAICREERNEYGPLLQLAQCFEEARWEDGEKLIHQLNLDARKVRSAFQVAVDWVSTLESVASAKAG